MTRSRFTLCDFMWRRLQHILVELSLLIWVATAVVWLRGKLVDWDGFGVGYRWERGELEEVNSFGKYRVKRAGPAGHTADGLYVASEQGSFGLRVVHQTLEAGAGMFSEELPGWRRLSGMPLTIEPIVDVDWLRRWGRCRVQGVELEARRSAVVRPAGGDAASRAVLVAVSAASRIDSPWALPFLRVRPPRLT